MMFPLFHVLWIHAHVKAYLRRASKEWWGCEGEKGRGGNGERKKVWTNDDTCYACIVCYSFIYFFSVIKHLVYMQTRTATTHEDEMNASIVCLSIFAATGYVFGWWIEIATSSYFRNAFTTHRYRTFSFLWATNLGSFRVHCLLQSHK